jgi:hypothetical protein
MTRDEVLALKARTHAMDVLPANQPTTVFNAYERATRSGVLLVFYPEWGTLCIGGGKVYNILFDKANRVRWWSIGQWSNSC